MTRSPDFARMSLSSVRWLMPWIAVFSRLLWRTPRARLHTGAPRPAISNRMPVQLYRRAKARLL